MANGPDFLKNTILPKFSSEDKPCLPDPEELKVVLNTAISENYVLTILEERFSSWNKMKR